MKSKRTQEQRTATTRAALIAAGRELFSTRGYGAVGTDDLAAAAGVTRGALYHQFGGKQELFAAVFEAVEQEIVDRLSEGAAGAGAASDPLAALHDDVGAWLRICAEPAVHRIAFIEAPAVLGWERWREIGRRHGVGLVELVLQGLVDSGVLSPQPLRALAHVLAGALEEGALYAARASDQAAATREVQAALQAVIAGLITDDPTGP